MKVTITNPAFDGDSFAVYVRYGYRSYLYSLCRTYGEALQKQFEARQTL